MNTNFWIGLLILVILVGGIYLLAQNYYAIDNGLNGTTTIPGNNAPPTNQPGAARVTTSPNVAASASTVVLNGTVVPNGAQTTYWYEYGRTTELGTRTSVQTIGSGYLTFPVPAYITGLSASTVYYFRLSAQNSFGIVNGETRSFTTNGQQPAPQGSSPTTRTNAATSIARTGATLNGRVTANSAETAVWFEFGETTSLGNTTALQSVGTSTGPADLSVSLSGLQPLTRYYFRLNAQNQFGTVNGATLNFTTLGPAEPTAPLIETQAATSVATTSVTLNGRVNPNGAETTYWFEYSRDSILGTILGTTVRTEIVGTTSTSRSVSAMAIGLTNDTNYYYRLVGQNVRGTSRGSIITFRTRP